MQHSSEAVLFAFALTLFAGLSTGIGSTMAFYTKRTNKKFLSIALGFSAGVMIYVSFMEILPKAIASLAATMPGNGGYWTATGAFFAGIFLIGLIDKLVPSYENPHELHDVDDMIKASDPNRIDFKGNDEDKELMRMGIFSALAIGIHNFPEGMATFIAALEDPNLGISIAIAIAIHNIPEGIAVSVPIYFATGDKKRAFKWSFLSGLSEPIGAIFAYLVFLQFANDMIFGLVFASVAGIMVYISLDELLPTAEKYGEHHLAIYGLVAGMAVMAVSLLLLA